MQAADGGLILNSRLEDFAAALTAWRERTNGKYDVVMTSRNYQWQISTAYVDQIQALVNRGLTEGAAAITNSDLMPGYKVIRSVAPPQSAGPGRQRAGRSLGRIDYTSPTTAPQGTANNRLDCLPMASAQPAPNGPPDHARTGNRRALPQWPDAFGAGEARTGEPQSGALDGDAAGKM